MTTLTNGEWFWIKADSLSENIKNNFNEFWKHVESYGLTNEVIDFTKRYYDELNNNLDCLNDDEERFMRAFHYAMDEWDL